MEIRIIAKTKGEFEKIEKILATLPSAVVAGINTAEFSPSTENLLICTTKETISPCTPQKIHLPKNPIEILQFEKCIAVYFEKIMFNLPLVYEGTIYNFAFVE